MKPAPFDYFAPTSVDEVRDLLTQYGDDAKILAGGQSLVPVMALRPAPLHQRPDGDARQRGDI
jgi:aerobic carbon-monoxide dehydrogenase medium subunit